MRHPRRRLALVAVVAGVAAAVAIPLALLLGGGRSHLVPRTRIGDPLAYGPGHDAALERSAAFGLSHVLYAKSPDGVIATARRTARFRPFVDDAVAGTRIDPALVEAIVFLESAGRPDVIAGSDPAAAAGLTQIVAETGIDFLRMPIDLAASRRLTRKIDRAAARRHLVRAARLRARRRVVDPRFDPAQALAATVRYLTAARARLGRDDLAVVSYHMGIGNLEGVLRAYGGGRVPYARLYFDSSPLRHAAAWARLAALGDDSRDYLWRVLAAKEIMRLYRTDLPHLRRLAVLHRRKASAEEVLHPARSTARFGDRHALEAAWRRGDVQPLPDDPAHLHFRADPHMGELAGDDARLYRGLRPEALALLVYLADGVHKIARSPAPLDVTSTVRDEGYQRVLVRRNLEATRAYSLHTTGYAFDVLRSYGSEAQAAAFQFELERLQALGLIAWVRERAAIHVTVASAARALVPTVLRRSG